MPLKSAGLLLYRLTDKIPEVFLVHPGGPLWKNKDAGAWSIPKGEFTDGEDALEAAKREFEEETGMTVHGAFIPLMPVRQKSGKMVHAWAVEQDIPAGSLQSNLFEMEWPPRSGKKQRFPEVDKGEWMTITGAREKINPGQTGLLDELARKLGIE
ncbi:MAG: NUDIX domain-containing protein [Chitinophagaceae bacterium]